MIENLPVYISVVFILATAVTLFFLYTIIRNANNSHARSKANIILASLAGWLMLQGILTISNFYENTQSVPPRFILIILPPLITIIIMFTTQKGRNFIDSLSPAGLTWLHIVRIPVEIVLFLLFVNKAIPELMTFSGRNFDILSGITAPFVAYFGIQRQRFSRKTILAWNFICLLLLLNIVINAVLSVPFTFQQFAFDQPNIAVLHFPFSWLPAFIVPAVLFAHLVSIRQLLKRK